MMRKLKKVISAVLVFIMLISLSAFAMADGEQTSFSYRFDARHRLVPILYPDYGRLAEEDMAIPVPGVERTKFADDDYAYNMVPQGLCTAGDYMLVTAYDYNKEHNSVIYVISDGELLSVLVLPDKNHMGGIAFDGEYVWVARSTSKEIGAIRYEDIVAAASTEVAEINYYEKVKCDTTASFITYFDEKIWVGLYDENNSGTLYGYTIDKSGEKMTLKTEHVLSIPKRTQGAAFFTLDGETYLAVSCSYSRYLSSKLTLFTVDFESEKTEKCKTFRLPPMYEEVEYTDGYLYVMSESAATEYAKGVSLNAIAPHDRISVFSAENLVNDNAVKSIFEKITDLLF